MTTASPSTTEWKQAVKPYTKPDLGRSIWQLVNTSVPFFVLWYCAYLSLDYSYALTLLLSIPLGGLTVRFFIINHDCGHGAFFASKQANTVVGIITGMLSYTPYHRWRHGHAIHHARSGQIEDRGVGYFWIMGVDEFRNAPKRTQLWYRFYRNPFVLFFIGGLYLFLVEFRLTFESTNRTQSIGVWATNIFLLTVVLIMGFTIGFWNFFLVQFPICAVAAFGGLSLFFVQHHYEESYWEDRENWDYTKAALQGSSYIKLDPISEWFAGAINYHHIHHLAPRVANYRLRAAHNEVPIFNAIKPLTWSDILSSWKLVLVDEKTKKWATWAEAEKPREAVAPQTTEEAEAPS